MVSQINSAAVSILNSYNSITQQLDNVQNAVATGYDVTKASDNPLVYSRATAMRAEASTYNSPIAQMTAQKSSIDRATSVLQTIADTAAKIRDTMAGMSSNASKADQVTAKSVIQGYLSTIQALTAKIDTGVDGFSNTGSSTYNIGGTATAPITLTNVAKALTVRGLYTNMLKPTNTAAFLGNGASYAAAAGTTVKGIDLSTATNRATFLDSITKFANTTVANAQTSLGAFSNQLDAQLKGFHAVQDGLNNEAEGMTKTDLTADSAKSAALQTQQQLLTSLLSMNNQRMSSVLSLFR